MHIPRKLKRIAALAAMPLIASAVYTGGSDDRSYSPPRAAIVDQLSFNAPNPDFSQRATALLEQAGYTVDYYPSDNVDVDLYRKLPSRDYDFIVFRVHTDRQEQIDDVILFSSEAYDTRKYVADQARNRLVIAQYQTDGKEYFGVASSRLFEKGDLDDATVIMMGCEGIVTPTTGEAFVDDGAENYIGWNGPVSATHTDAATQKLLELLVIEKLPPVDALAKTMNEVGPDPVYGSTLGFVYKP